MRKVKDAVDLTTNEKIYFKGHARATYLSDGRNVEEGIRKKQDNITDLATIRSGAAKGATAIQEVKTINGQSIVGSGNIEIQGGSGGGMTTPSGDPMHYMFEAVGATYNATDADIPMVGIYGDSYVHKAKHWHLNELGDITNEEMRQIYSADIGDGMSWNRILAYYPLRTHKNFYYYGYNSDSAQFRDLSIMNGIISTKLVTFLMPPIVNNNIPLFQNPTSFLYNSKQITKILNPFKFAHNIGSAGFLNATNLREMRLHSVAWSISFASCSNLSNASILYMIENAVAANITITLHASAYDRAMADADIQAAMTSKQVNLAKA